MCQVMIYQCYGARRVVIKQGGVTISVLLCFTIIISICWFHSSSIIKICCFFFILLNALKYSTNVLFDSTIVFNCSLEREGIEN